MRTYRQRARQIVASSAVGAMVAAGAVVVAGLAAGVVLASPASADPAPIGEGTASTVTADALPTAQINGVVWSQVVVGNSVYAAGNFTQARPAGVAVGGAGSVARGNLMSYNLTTGGLTSFAPTLNAQAKVVTASPDGSRIYVGGSFTTANGQNRYRIAAYSTATGQLIIDVRTDPGRDGQRDHRDEHDGLRRRGVQQREQRCALQAGRVQRVERSAARLGADRQQ